MKCFTKILKRLKRIQGDLLNTALFAQKQGLKGSRLSQIMPGKHYFFNRSRIEKQDKRVTSDWIPAMMGNGRTHQELLLITTEDRKLNNGRRIIMKTLTTKTGKTCSVALAALLGLGLSIGDASAQESLVTGTSITTPNNTITGTAPDELVHKTVILPLNTGTWQCMVTGSAEAINPLNGDDNRYVFGFSEGKVLPAATQAGGDRTIDFDNIFSTEETDRTVVSSVYVFTGLSTATNENEHTFYWSARKENGADANMNIEDSSMGVVCSDFPDAL